MRILILRIKWQNDKNEAEQQSQDKESEEFWVRLIDISHVSKIKALYLSNAEDDSHNKLNDDVLVFFEDQQLVEIAWDEDEAIQ